MTNRIESRVWHGWDYGARDGSRQRGWWWELRWPDGSVGDASGPYGSRAEADADACDALSHMQP